ncbi:hypothetical protein ACFPOI_25390 [Nonomuraea angiospora]|uniref:hypothetical protein n=1 Tax=Nonomuraea angiospora TaxID=46172 RepID=UPI0036233874
MLVPTFLADPAPARRTPPVLPPPVIAMMSAVRAHWSDGVSRPVPMRELASAARVSPSALCRTLRRTAPEAAPPSPAESHGLTVLQPLVQAP